MPGRSPGVFYNFHRLEYMRMRTYYMINSLFNQPVSQFTLRSFRERTIFHSPMHTGYNNIRKFSACIKNIFFYLFPINIIHHIRSISLQAIRSISIVQQLSLIHMSQSITGSSYDVLPGSYRFQHDVFSKNPASG